MEPESRRTYSNKQHIRMINMLFKIIKDVLSAESAKPLRIIRTLTIHDCYISRN